MKDIKKIVLFSDETSKDGGSWLIIRDSGYESVSLNEGKRICAEYAAMNGITTREMVNEQLLNKVVFYSSDFNSALRDYVFNNNNNDYKNVHAENNDIVSGMPDNLSNDGDYMLVEDAKEVVEALEEKPNQFVKGGDPYVPVEGNADLKSSKSSEVSGSEILSREEEDNADNIPVEDAEEVVEALEEKPFVMLGKPYVLVEGNGDSNSSESSEVSGSEILSREEDNVDNNPVEETEEVVEAEEEKPNQFVKGGDPYVPVEGNDDLNFSKYFEVIDDDDEVEEEPTREEDDDEEIEEVPTREEEEEDDDDDDEIEEEPTSEEGHEEEVEEEPTREEDDDDEEEVEEVPTREEEDDDDDEEIEEEPTSEEEHEEKVEEEPTREDDDEEIEEEPTSEEEHEEEVSEEETMDEEDIGIIDKIKKFGNSALEKLKKFTIFGTIVGMLVAGIVSIFGVKYSLNRDKDDIYVTHSSNTEEIPDDEYLYSSPLANFVDGVINKFFPTNESVTDEESDNVSNNTDDNSDLPNIYVPYSFDREFCDNDGEKVAIAETGLAETIADSGDETEYDNYGLAESDLVETSTNLDTAETGHAETIANNDINETKLIEPTTNSDLYNDDDVSSFEEAFLVNTKKVTNETYFTTDPDFYGIAADGSEDAALEGFDGIEFFDGYDADNTLNYTTDSSGDQTDLELIDPNYYSAYIDDYINSLESRDVSESGRQYVKTA